MKARDAMALALALLALCAGASRPDGPEPPPPVDVKSARGATVTVSAGTNGPLIKVKSDPAMAKKGKKGKVKVAAGAIDLTFKQKWAPARVTFQFRSHESLTGFSLNADGNKAYLGEVAAKGKQVTQFTAAGAVTTDAKAAAVTLTATPGEDYLEVRVDHQKGGLGATWNVQWRGPLKD